MNNNEDLSVDICFPRITTWSIFSPLYCGPQYILGRELPGFFFNNICFCSVDVKFSSLTMALKIFCFRTKHHILFWLHNDVKVNWEKTHCHLINKWLKSFLYFSISHEKHNFLSKTVWEIVTGIQCNYSRLVMVVNQMEIRW